MLDTLTTVGQKCDTTEALPSVRMEGPDDRAKCSLACSTTAPEAVRRTPLGGETKMLGPPAVGLARARHELFSRSCVY